MMIVCTLFISCNKSTDFQDSQNTSHVQGVLNHISYSNDVAFNKVPQGIQGDKGIGFVRSSDRLKTFNLRPQTVELTKSDIENIFLLIVNNTQNEKIFLISTILNYKQIKFSIDKKESLLHEIKVPPQTEMELPFLVYVDSPGIHDLQVIAFEDPYNKTLDADYRMNLSGNVVARRARIVIGESKEPYRKLSHENISRPVPNAVSFRPSMGFAKEPMSTTHPSQRQFYTDIAEREQLYPFQIHFTNEEDKTVDFAILLFFNYHQVPIRNQDVFVATIKPNEEGIIDASLQMPQEPSVYQMQLVYLLDPYQSVLQKDTASAFVSGSPRVAIEVK
jgi:hypothetical protein